MSSNIYKVGSEPGSLSDGLSGWPVDYASGSEGRYPKISGDRALAFQW
jgi:hypothetical protein